MPFAAAWMQLKIIIPNEVNQREKQIPYNTTYGVPIRTQMNLSMKWKQNHGHREQTSDCQGGGVLWRDGVGVWE